MNEDIVQLYQKQKSRTEIILLLVLVFLVVATVVYSLRISNKYNEVAEKYNVLYNDCWCITGEAPEVDNGNEKMSYVWQPNVSQADDV